MKFISKRRVAVNVSSLAMTMLAVSACSQPVGEQDPTNSLTESRSPIIQTEMGKVAGSTTAGVDKFIGIPYAAPPVGKLRWQAPEPHQSWNDVRSATSYGPPCTQSASDDEDNNSDEDCLYLNIYRPTTEPEKPRPVLFWIHGGGLMNGSGSEYDGTLLAKVNDIIVVTVNYRLGVFGFLNIPELSDSGTANYGLLDQQAAMRWTHDNISSFGGDPNRVTIAGESGGGHAVCAQLASPSAAGLFDGAIIQSGGCPSHTMAEAAADGEVFATSAGCPDVANMATCLRTKSTSVLLEASKGFGGILTGPLPVAGGPELPLAPDAAVKSGRISNVPILIGATHDEVRAWASPHAEDTEGEYEAEIRREFGTLADEVLARYPFAAYPSPHTAAYALGAVWTDSSVFYGLGGCQYRELAEQFADQQPQTFFYQFDDVNAPTSGRGLPGLEVGAAHATELPYLWPSVADGSLVSQFTPNQRGLSQTMVRFWGAFVKNSDPNTSEDANWPKLAEGQLMSLQSDGSHSISDAQYSADHNCGFWNSNDYGWLTINP